LGTEISRSLFLFNNKQQRRTKWTMLRFRLRRRLPPPANKKQRTSTQNKINCTKAQEEDDKGDIEETTNNGADNKNHRRRSTLQNQNQQQLAEIRSKVSAKSTAANSSCVATMDRQSDTLSLGVGIGFPFHQRCL
jgi:hypothetical protein